MFLTVCHTMLPGCPQGQRSGRSAGPAQQRIRRAVKPPWWRLSIPARASGRTQAGVPLW